MIQRKALNFLHIWRNRPNRKPLILRGARQVGKTKLVTELFGKTEFKQLVTINFELSPEMADYFESKDPQKIVPLVEAATGQRIIDGETLLFLDEVQGAPSVLKSLRYFYELRSQLHVIAAGSLLEFALAHAEYSIPVGRVEYLFLEPLSFEEFLPAIGKGSLLDWIKQFRIGDVMPPALHQQLMEGVRTYWMIGGMPEAVALFAATHSFLEVERCQQSLLTTYVEDFAKYRKRVPLEMLQRVFLSLPLQIGRKFVYAQVDRDVRSREISAAVELLAKARILTRVNRATGNDIPLGAGADTRNFKAYCLDIGLCAHQMGLSIANLQGPIDERFMAERGGLCEQFVAENLKCTAGEQADPVLYHWAREHASSNAEVDFLIQVGASVVPVEVKAGSTGTMRSLHQFLIEKNLDFGVRINGDIPSFINTTFKDSTSAAHPFRLLSLPFYLCGQVDRLVLSLS